MESDLPLKNQQFITDLLENRLAELAQHLQHHWGETQAIDDYLVQAFESKRYAHLLYVMDKSGQQVSANVSPENVDTSVRGQDLSKRPYLDTIQPYEGMLLSKPYLSLVQRKPAITAVHAIRKDNELLGFVAADIYLSNLPYNNDMPVAPEAWQQFKGDPSIRRTLFMQERTNSRMDEDIDHVMDLLYALMTEHGVFHGKLHFSSSRATLWHYDDPYNYRPLTFDEFTDTRLFLRYAKQDYPVNTKITPQQLKQIFDQFKELRNADEVIYLRASSVNVINGLVALNFSCDGSHYMQANEFLDKDLGFWFGNNSLSCDM